MSLPFQLVRNNAFSKLKKAIKKNDVEKMVLSMLHLEFNGEGGGTRGEFVRHETMRALRHLKHLHKGAVPPTVLGALEIAKEKAGKVWEQVAPPPELKAEDLTPNPFTAPNG